jgi:hypothetical protein
MHGANSALTTSRASSHTPPWTRASALRWRGDAKPERSVISAAGPTAAELRGPVGEANLAAPGTLRALWARFQHDRLATAAGFPDRGWTVYGG